MKQIAILVPESSVLQTISAPQYLFTAINQFLTASGKAPLFEVQLVGATASVQLNNGLFTVHTNQLLNETTQPDLVIIPALFGDMQQAVAANSNLLPWINQQYQRGAEVASLCVGAFLLAATGLLNGKKCSTHWGFTNEFKCAYPNVKLVEGSIVTDENGLYSSGGANSFWNLLLYLVEKYTDRSMAIMAAKYFAIDIDRNSQTAFTLFKGQKAHTDAAIQQAQTYIEDHIGDKINIDTLATQCAVGKRSFERRFKKATHNTVAEYIQRIKIEAAKRLLESSNKNITEIMYEVGYTDAKAFRELFRKNTGLTPIEYRSKYNKQPMVA